MKMRTARFFYLPILFLQPACVWGVIIPGYNAEAHDRFEIGYPDAPVPNTSPVFIGAELDWSGVGWAENDTRKGLGFLSPQHYLMARHFRESNGNNIVIFGADDALHAQTQASRQAFALGVYFGPPREYNDLAAGRLNASFPRSAMPVRYPVLDLHATSSATTGSNYTGLEVLMYGRGATNPVSSPRVGQATVQEVNFLHGTTIQQQQMITDWSDVRLQDGDSGSPGHHVWTNPNGGRELALVSMHSAIDNDEERNIDSFVASPMAINALNDFMRPDGRALRVAGNPNGTWAGGTGGPQQSANLTRSRNWDGSHSDQYVVFNAADTTFLAPVVDDNTSLRGLYFLSTASAGDGFTFTGSDILTVGRGGVVNYDNSPQVFQAPLQLGADQVWHAGPGGVTVTSLDTNGFLLELDDENILTISGEVSGSGGLALGRGLMILDGNSTYTGGTWVHEGELRVNGSIASSSAVRTGTGGELTGTGGVSVIRGAGKVRPHPGVLSAIQADPASGLGFAFTLSSQDPASNPVLRLSGATPFSASLTSANRIEVLFDVGHLASEQVYRGGFFTDETDEFSASVSNADWVFRVLDGDEPQPLPGDLEIVLSSESAQLDVGGTQVDGRVLVLTVQSVPEPDPYQVWVDEVFPEGTPEAEKDPFFAPNDFGIMNLLAYAHRLDPLHPDMRLLPRGGIENGDWVLRFRRNPAATDLVYRVEKTESLSANNWEDTQRVPEVIDPDPDGDGGAELMAVRVPKASAPPLLFLRVHVETADF